jgi:hypothetical protein
MTIHQLLLIYTKIRTKRTYIPKMYTVDVFPNYTDIHTQASPSISVHKGLIPMPSSVELLEPSFLNLLTAIERAADLPDQQRLHWTCSLRQIAKWLDRPADVIPARWSAVRFSISQLHHARIGVTAKTLANHKANVSAALRWFGNGHTVAQHGVPLSAKWARFGEPLDKRTRDRLYSLIRYCSARRIGPESIDDAIFEEYWRYRTETTARASNNTARRFMIRAWNACGAEIDGWSLRRLTEPTPQGHRARVGCFPRRTAQRH